MAFYLSVRVNYPKRVNVIIPDLVQFLRSVEQFAQFFFEWIVFHRPVQALQERNFPARRYELLPKHLCKCMIDLQGKRGRSHEHVFEKRPMPEQPPERSRMVGKLVERDSNALPSRTYDAFVFIFRSQSAIAQAWL